MMPNHNFDSKIDNQHSFESKIDNLHRFDSIINIIRYFESIVDAGYFNSDFWKADFGSAINIVVGTIHSSTRISTPVSIGPISFVVNRLLVELKTNQKAEFISTHTIFAILKMATRIGAVGFQTSVPSTIPQITMVASPTFRKYYMLDDWDAELLSTLDTMNLSAMDYQTV
jgi:hypothetical protein